MKLAMKGFTISYTFVSNSVIEEASNFNIFVLGMTTVIYKLRHPITLELDRKLGEHARQFYVSIELDLKDN